MSMQYVGNRNRTRRFLGNIGGASAALLPFADTFVRADGDLNNGWNYTAGKWTISGNAALGTPALGANVIINGDFELGDVNWVKGSGWSIAGGMATRIPDASTTAIAQSSLTSGKWYQVNFDVVRNDGNFSPGYWDIMWPVPASANGSYEHTGHAGSAAAQIECNPPGDGDVDNVVYREITLADTFCSRNFGNSNIDITVPITALSATQSGVVLCLDSITNPQNFIIAYLEFTRTRIRLVKCVGGVYTSLIAASVVYAAGREMRVVKSGSDVSLFYNGVQISTTKTVADAGIVNNMRHGMFSTHAGNSFGSFTANP